MSERIETENAEEVREDFSELSPRERKKAERKARLAKRKADPRSMRERVYDEIAQYVSVKTMDYVIIGLVILLLVIVGVGMFV